MFSTGEVGAAIDAAAEAKVEVEEEEEDEDGGAPSSKGLGEGEEDMVGIEELLRGREGRKKKKK